MSLSISTIRQIVRLILTQNYSNRRIAELCGTSGTTIGLYRRKLMDAKIGRWSEIENLDDALYKSLFVFSSTTESNKRIPDWTYIHHLMQVKHQTLAQCHKDYRDIEPATAYSYSQFTHYYREFTKKLDLSMRQYYRPGEVAFVDFAGKRLPWICPQTGVEHWAEIFVGVLGFSQLIFTVAVPGQKLEDWSDAHVKMFAYYKGVPRIVVPDNLKSGVTKPGKVPQINPAYQEMAEHYGFVIEPARVRKPQDKSLAEIGVLLVTRWITVVLRRRKFFSLEEINKAIVELLESLNQRQFKRIEGTRRSRFEDHEAETLMPLPERQFESGQWLVHQKVASDYHIYALSHAYSVPYQLAHEYVDVKICHKKIEIYYQRKLVAIHVRSHVNGGATTDNKHRPQSHRAYAQQSRSNYLEWAERIGENARALVLAQFDNDPGYSIKGCKASARLQDLAKKYGPQRFERACKCAVDMLSLTYTSVRSILECHLDDSSEEKPFQSQLPFHHNVRGAEYYQERGASDE